MSGLDPDPVRAPGASAVDSARPASQETGSAGSIGAIVADLSKDFTTLMRQEVELAKAEVSNSAKQAGLGAGLYGGGGLAIHFSALFVSLALWWWVGSAIGYGWSAVIGAAVWAVIGAVLMVRAKGAMSNVTGMTQTAETARQIPDAPKGKDHQQ